MDKIPTAEEFLNKQHSPHYDRCLINHLTDFAKLHVQAALKEAIIIGGRVDDSNIFKVALYNAYPLENIT